MNNFIEISVIIPSYNHASYLEQRIQTVLNQTYPISELIILDDASPDHSQQIISRYSSDPRISHIIFNENNSGSTFNQWQKGLELAKSPWVWIAESDDYADLTFLEKMAGLIHHYPNVGIAFCRSQIVDENNEVVYYSYNHKKFSFGPSEIKDTLSSGYCLPNVSACLLKRNYALSAVVGLGKYKASGDLIFYTRILHYANIAYEDSTLNYFRDHAGNVSRPAKVNGLWVTEGVDVIGNINFSLVDFPVYTFLRISYHWLRRVDKITFKNKIKVFKKLLSASWNFGHAKLLGIFRSSDYEFNS
ncbi:glycosyltransferase family 2 protein [Mucilaginibacter sp. CSA2-8R]|uniref:glycosyltransferase family 2 protein n=1 Tax=Mucilaginibacter sp. CSA2-8R TaxID=3141542 RepID=UPI00315C5733